MTVIHIDFETRSAVDLKKAGVHAYAEDPTTDIWCMAYAADHHPVKLWTRDQCGAAEVRRALFAQIRAGATFVAHNAAFELAIWNGLMVPRYGWPHLPVEQTRCTMTMAYALGLPGSLENAAAAVGIEAKKDMDGHALMMRMSRPRRTEKDGSLVWWTDPDKLERLYAYCRQDIEVERALETRLLPLSSSELALWHLDQRINDRGILVNARVIEAALGVVDDWKAHLDREMVRVTGGFVGGCSKVVDLMDWIAMRGVTTTGVAKADVLDMLARDLPADVRAALELRRDAAKTSTAKLKSMRAAASRDGRVRGILQFHGAATGRWAGRRIQPQNFPRPSMSQDDIDDVLNMLSEEDPCDARSLPP